MELGNLKDQWQQTPTWQKVFLIVALVGGVLYLSFITLISPKYDEYKALKEEVQNLESELEILKSSLNPQIQTALEKKLKEVEKEIKTNESKLEMMEKIIPPKPNVEDILSTLSLSAKKSMVVLNSFKVEKEEDVILYYDKNTGKLEVFNPKKEDSQNIPENAIKLKKISIVANIVGSFNLTKNFLDEISKSERFISTESISIKKEGSMLNSTLKLSVYYMPENS